MTLLSSPAGLPSLRNGSPFWRPELEERASRLRHHLARVDGDAFSRSLDREIRRRLDALMTGIERYRHHPYHRDLPDPPTVYREGGSRLLDYSQPGAAGLPVLFVPSLVNRHYVLDLSSAASLMRWMAGQGFRPFLIDWGEPGPLERRFTLTDYIAGRLERVLDQVAEQVGRPPAVVGYCMGGLLAAALALRQPRRVSSLTLMATPWDFHAENAALACRMERLFQPFAGLLDAWGEMPVDVLQALFAQLDPFLALKKFSQFARMDMNSPAAAAFVALEDWLNDGIALSAPVAREALAGWYGRNDTAQGRWTVGGMPVDPAAITVPTLALIPARDRIVPPSSATALIQKIPRGQTIMPQFGHIGMVVSTAAQNGVWRPLAEWLNAIG
ncbi:polyhydroxyalkanoate synthase [Azospirillum fermentarium]|uniref:alpha/beta fold hydrolase n=1 Tax=Azospirillum fermentarium TaxID=1233114 RepID=UPI0022269CDB|nr:alpha/beta fold hydrolase [Azospirillum fermentarium]MCW2246144.1 polyhydroxyalkanoate synthase [Azospirillum fermentarium]